MKNPKPTTKASVESQQNFDIKGKYLGLTEQEFDRFASACHRTWETIGGDVLGDESAGNSIPVVEVIECTLDANYMEIYGSYQKDWRDLYKTRIRPWLDVVYHLPRFKRLMTTEVFKFKRYGW
jgi:hypothetical protein